MKRKFLVEIDMDEDDTDDSSDLSYLISREWGYEVTAKEITNVETIDRRFLHDGIITPEEMRKRLL